MASFYREKTTDCGPGRYKDVDIYLYSGKRQTATENRRRKRYRESTPQQKNLNDKNAKIYFFRLAKLNFFPGDIHLTLTYDDRFLPADEEEAKKIVRRFIRRVRAWRKKNNLPELKYIVVTSVYSSDGEPTRIHHHILFNSVPAALRDELEELWKLGIANADKIKNVHNAMNKLVGYIGKQSSGKKHFFSSMNLKRPTYYRVDGKFTKNQIEKIARGDAYQPEFWERKYPGWKIVDRDHDIKVEYNEFSGWYIRLQLTNEKILR